MTDHIYLLKVVSKDMTGYGGFVWPMSGKVSAPDWDPSPECGGGLHGWLWGEGAGGAANIEPDSRWLVLRARADQVVDLGGKVKVPEADVAFCGDMHEAARYIIDKGATGPVIGARVEVGDREIAHVGDRGTAKAGVWGIAIAGYHGTAQAGDHGTAQAVYLGAAKAGDYGSARAGYRGTAQAGDGGTARAGDWGTAQAGAGGIAIAVYRGTAMAGAWGIAIAGEGGTARAGAGGVIVLTTLDGHKISGTVGEGGIKPDTPYRLDDDDKFVEAG